MIPADWLYVRQTNAIISLTWLMSGLRMEGTGASAACENPLPSSQLRPRSRETRIGSEETISLLPLRQAAGRRNGSYGETKLNLSEAARNEMRNKTQ